MTALRVNRSVTIPQDELEMRFSPSGGPGGQHSNKVATRVELSWNVKTSRAVSARQKQAILGALRHRVDGAGNLRVVADEYRSQLRNREAARQRLVGLLVEALRPRKTRVGTVPHAGARERRLQEKRRRSETKKMRGDPLRDQS